MEQTWMLSCRTSSYEYKQGRLNNMKKSSALLLAVALASSAAVMANTATPGNTNNTASGNMNAPAAKQIKWLGVTLMPISPAMKSQLGDVIVGNAGVMIRDVQQNSPAAKAGLQAYDVLLAFNGNDINSAGQVYDLVQQSSADQDVKLDIVRQGKKQTITAKIGTRNVANNMQRPWPGYRGFNNDFWNSPFPQFGQQPGWGRPFMQPNWPDFFGPGFGNNFPSMPPNMPKGGSNSNVQTWSQSESMSVKTLPNGNIRAELKTKDTNGDERNFVYEGEQSTVIKQIEAQKDLPDAQKSRLLGAITGSGFSFSFGNNFGQRFQQGPSFGHPWWNNQPQNRPQWRGNSY